MGTLAPGGRITEPVVQEELARLRAAWAHPEADTGAGLLREVLGEERLAALDAFDRVQLQEVVRVCRGARSLSEAGRQLFAVSREQKAQPNDADRLRKYLARFGLSWGSVQSATRLQQ